MLNPIIHVHIADIHFGALNPVTQLQILQEQFIYKIQNIPFNILAIDGDLFDKKVSANSPVVECAIRFVNQCLQMCLERNAMMIMISGTESHEASQLSLFKDYERIYGNNFHIVENIQFVYYMGYKILCIPEEYSKPAYYYESKLCETYDMCFMHGTLVGGVYGANKEKLQSNREAVFSIESFSSCKGPIISGHVHKAMCLNSNMYYVSNPIRYKFGEEEEKGFGICISSPLGHKYTFMPITSFRYDTIPLSALGTNDPDIIVKKLDELQANGIDFIRLDMSDSAIKENFATPIINILEAKYAQNPHISLIKPSVEKSILINTTEDIMNKYSGMDFLLDKNMSELDKFVQYINYNKGCDFITVDKLKSILNGSMNFI